MHDDELNQLRGDWRNHHESVSPHEIGQWLLRQQRMAYVWLVAELLGVIMIIAAGITFVLWMQRAFDPLLVLGACALLLALPVAVYSIRLRFSMLNEYRQTPEALLQQAQRQLFIELRVMKVSLWGAWILLASMFGLFGLYLAGHIATTDAFMIGAGWGVAAGAIVLWAWRRKRAILRRLENCEHLLADFGDEPE